MEPRDYRVCLRTWLGLPVHEINPAYPPACPACKKALLDKWGDHSVVCAKHCDRISKHDSVRDIIKCYLSYGALSSRIVQRETPGLIVGKKDKPADIFVSNWHGGKSMAFDITIVSPMQKKLRAKAAKAAGVAAEEGEISKIAKCEDKCRKAGFDFTPLAFSTYGGYGEEAKSVLKYIICMAADRLVLTRSAVATRIRQKNISGHHET